MKGYYIYAASFLLTIFTTVGYGNDYSHTQIEEFFIIFIAFGSFIVQGGLILGMQKVFNKINLSFEEQVEVKLNKIDAWLIKLQN